MTHIIPDPESLYKDMAIIWVPLTIRGSHVFWDSLKIPLICCFASRMETSISLLISYSMITQALQKNEAKSEKKTSLTHRTIGSMYGIFPYIYQKFMPNEGKYPINGSYG